MQNTKTVDILVVALDQAQAVREVERALANTSFDIVLAPVRVKEPTGGLKGYRVHLHIPDLSAYEVEATP